MKCGRQAVDVFTQMQQAIPKVLAALEPIIDHMLEAFGQLGRAFGTVSESPRRK